MTEDLLHYLWQNKLYRPGQFYTQDQDVLEIIHPGTINTDAGPDFFNAKIKIGDTLWAGNVELHLREDDWFHHKHHVDSAYDNVILHVVDKPTGETVTSAGRKVPVWRLQYADQLFTRYQSLYFNDQWVACQDEVTQIDEFSIDRWLDRLLIEKLEAKSRQIENWLLMSENDWDQVFFIMLARSFGFGVNGQPFEMLARQTPLKILLKHSDHLFQLEALLLGQSGFLSSLKHTDEYTEKLLKEYWFLAHKYKLSPIENHLWKFLRLRPSNFPTIRLVQMAALIHQSRGLFDRLHANLELNKMSALLEVAPSGYWSCHYRPGCSSKANKIKKLGKYSRQLIISNTIIPYLFVFYSKRNDEKGKEQVLDMLYDLQPEKNKITENWRKIGLNVDNEGRAQALIFLKNNYCNHKKCLNCHIGHKVLSR